VPKQEGKLLMPDDSPAPPQARPNEPATVDFSQAEYKRFYANHVATTMSLFEVRAIFTSVQGLDPTTDKLVADETMHVRMAPELAFSLVQQLQKALREYVTLFGALRPTRVFPPVEPTPSASAPSPEGSPQTPDSPESPA
jgi:hypothetical protein